MGGRKEGTAVFRCFSEGLRIRPHSAVSPGPGWLGSCALGPTPSPSEASVTSQMTKPGAGRGAIPFRDKVFPRDDSGTTHFAPGGRVGTDYVSE